MTLESLFPSTKLFLVDTVSYSSANGEETRDILRDDFKRTVMLSYEKFKPRVVRTLSIIFNHFLRRLVLDV